MTGSASASADPRLSGRPARHLARAALLLSLLAAAPASSLAEGLAPPAASTARDTLVAGSLWRHFGIEECADLAGRPVTQVTAKPHDIWDPLPEGVLGRVYAFGNRLHIRTRPATVMASVLVREGQAFDVGRVAESERALRALRFLSPESVLVRVRSDSVELEFHTRDRWTTNPELNLESGGGQLYGSVSLIERNFLGLGWWLAGEYREDPVGITRGLSVSNSHAFGSAWRTEFVASTGTAGKSNAFALEHPFRGEEGRRSMGVRWSRISSEAQLFDRGSLAARLPRRTEEAEVWWGAGERTPTGQVRRARVVVAVLDRQLEAARLEPLAAVEFASPKDDLRQRRLGGEVRLWRPRFIQRTGIDRFERVEDFDLGSSVTLEAAFAPKAFGGTVDEGYAQLRLAAGTETGAAGFGLVRAGVRSRFRRDLREVVGTLSARWIEQPFSRMSLVMAAKGEAGHDTPRDFQPVVGGLDGLRAYPVHALAGTQVWRLNAEARFRGGRAAGDLLHVGGAIFSDAARAWGLGASDAPWHHDAGFGLRIALPHVSLDDVLRIDIAWPISPTRDGRREPVLTFGSSQAF